MHSPCLNYAIFFPHCLGTIRRKAFLGPQARQSSHIQAQSLVLSWSAAASSREKSVSEPLILVWRKMVLLSHCMNMGHVEFCQVHKAAEMILHSPGKAYALTPMCMRTSEKQVNTEMSFRSALRLHGTSDSYKPCCAQAGCACGRVAEV